MTEENKTVAPQAEEAPKEVVQVSETEMKEINDKIETVETTKLEAAKQEGVQEGKTIAQMEAELTALREQNAKIAAEKAEAEKKADLERQLAEEKAKIEQPVRKNVVPQSDNPVTNTNTQKAEDLPPLSIKEEWEVFESGFRQPVSATLPVDYYKNKNKVN